MKPAHPQAPSGTLQLHVSELKVGMFVVELDRPWLETPFILQGFELQSLADIEEVQKYCEFVFVQKSYSGAVANQAEAVASRQPTPVRALRRLSPTPDFGAASATTESAQSVTRSLLDDVQLGRAIDVAQANATVEACIRNIMADPTAMLWMSRIRSISERVTEHTMNVTILSIIVGHHLGLEGEELHKLGIGALLHDVGIMRLPEELIGKQNRTLEEEALYREHCRYGFSILISHKDLHTSAADVAYSHHEHVDGTGYPRGFTGDQLSLFARVVAICNAYDEITVDGVEGAVLDASQAIDYLRRYAGTRYDAELVAAFADCIGRYPSGCVVELRNGCIGLVVKQNRQHRDLPSVLVVRGADKQPCPESMVDLGRLALSGEGSPLKVASVLPNGAHGVRLEDYVKKGLRLS